MIDFDLALKSYKLQEPLYFYSVADTISYKIRASGGGLTHLRISYIVQEQDNPNEWFRFGFEYPEYITLENFLSLIRQAEIQFLDQLSRFTAKTFDPDGGDLGRGDLGRE